MKNLGKRLENVEENKEVKNVLKSINNSPEIYYDKEFDCNCTFLYLENDNKYSYHKNKEVKRKLDKKLMKMDAWVFVCNIVSMVGDKPLKYLKVCWAPETDKEFSPVPHRLKHITNKTYKKHCLEIIKKEIKENIEDFGEDYYFLSREYDSLPKDLINYLEHKGIVVEPRINGVLTGTSFSYKKPKKKGSWFFNS